MTLRELLTEAQTRLAEGNQQDVRVIVVTRVIEESLAEGGLSSDILDHP